MGRFFKSWTPCLHHDWEEIEGEYGLFRCRNPKCLVKGFQRETRNAKFGTVTKQSIRPYTCRSSGCSNPTLENGEQCPRCINKEYLRRKRKHSKDSLTPNQQEAMDLLKTSKEPIQCEQGASRVFDSLHDKGLVIKKTVTLWSLSKKGEKLWTGNDETRE